ncbi:MAG: hypothetical protein K6G24_06510, partial [Lachnospiraceae bacterium]|nr:hypothetical protein [Lachnospiraceae bacterium]
MPPLRNQGSFGACWAFAGLGAAEANLLKYQTGFDRNTIDMSEVQIAYYENSGPGIVDPLGGIEGDRDGQRVNVHSSYLNLGGNAYGTAKMLSLWIGAASESRSRYFRYPENDFAVYETLPDDCAFVSDGKLLGWYKAEPADHPEEVKKLIMKYGAVSTLIYTDTKNYLPDEYNADTNAYYAFVHNVQYGQERNYHPGANHEVCIVGWDDTFSKDNFLYTPSRDGAWLVRNSWRSLDTYAGYGDGSYLYNQDLQSYFWVSYDESEMDYAVAFDLTDGSFLDHNYEYDGAEGSATLTYEASRVLVANVFTAVEDEIVQYVAFDTFNIQNNDGTANYANADCTVKIYRMPEGCTTPLPENEVTDAATDIHVDYVGQNYVKLNKPVYIASGETFAALVDIPYPDGNARVTIENDSLTGTHADPGESLLSIDGGTTWKDIGALYNANLRVKAFTNVARRVITFDANGGTMKKNGNDVETLEKTFMYGSSFSSLPTPTRP